MLRQTTPSSPLSHGLVPPSKPVLGSGGSGRVLGTFRPQFLPVFPSPSSGAAWGGRSGPWHHLRTLPSPARALIPLPSVGGSSLSTTPAPLRARTASAGSCSRTLPAPLWPWPIHPLGLSHPRRHQAVRKGTHVSAAAPQAPGPPTVPASSASGLCRVAGPVTLLLLPSPGVLGPV